MQVVDMALGMRSDLNLPSDKRNMGARNLRLEGGKNIDLETGAVGRVPSWQSLPHETSRPRS